MFVDVVKIQAAANSPLPFAAGSYDVEYNDGRKALLKQMFATANSKNRFVNNQHRYTFVKAKRSAIQSL